MTDTSRLTDALSDRYRIERELGAGGMATVYLAQDVRHARHVAIKVLRPELAAVIGAERFLREIKTIATLQHPHILGLIDSGEVNGTAYYVMPYVEGESLRDRLNREKQLPINDAIRLATEVAGALDYAHRHGVIHRDIKPENILLHDGQALVADFGIALAVQSAGGARMTETGMSLGTPHYMSPEQAMGEREITARSDVYALGAMTYEMLIGDPPFTGSTAQAIVAKVMTSEPAGLIAQRKSIPVAVEEAVLTALEKLPADRFASAAEFATALAGERAGAPRSPRPGASHWSRGRWATVLVAATALISGSFMAGRWAVGRARLPQFSQLTYHEQGIFTARFASDGETIVYSAMTADSIPELFIIRPDYAEPTPLGLRNMQLLALSSKAELAVLLQPRYLTHRLFQGTLARVPVGGGAPREVLENVREADWSPDGSALAIIHEVDGRDRLEYPEGKVLYEAGGYLSDLRVSPDGKHIAFMEHPFRWDDRGVVAIVDREGATIAKSPDYGSLEGIAWQPAGDAVLFAGFGKTLMMLFELTLAGRTREVLSGTGDLTVHDVAPSGRVLLTRDDWVYRLMLRSARTGQERDVSWLNSSFRPALTADGTLLAFANGGSDAGPLYTVMLMRTDGGKVARLGEGAPEEFSHNGASLLVVVPSKPPAVLIYPTGAGAERRIAVDSMESIGWARWFPGDTVILFCGTRANKSSRCFAQSVTGGVARALTPEGTTEAHISPDGRQIVDFGQGIGYHIFAVPNGERRKIAGLAEQERVVRWSADGQAVYVVGESSHIVDRLDVTTGRRAHVVELGAGQSNGLWKVRFLSVADDPRTVAYVGMPLLSQLFTVEGVR